MAFQPISGISDLICPLTTSSMPATTTTTLMILVMPTTMVEATTNGLKIEQTASQHGTEPEAEPFMLSFSFYLQTVT